MVNKVMLLGRLGEDPVSKVFGNTRLCEMRLATEKGRGEKKVTEWHNIKAFGDLGDLCLKFLSSGRMIFITGEISSKEINGKKYIDIIANEVQFL